MLGSETTIDNVSHGRAVQGAVIARTPDLVIVDSQIGSMGGIAVTLDLHNEESGGRLPHIPVLMLLDRQPDVYLARQSNVEGYLVKPLDPLRLGRAIAAVLGGATFEDRAQMGDASTNYRSTPDSSAR